jgi:hypothetical protein
MEKTTNIWKWRDGELSSKEFYKLNSEEKKKYLEEIQNIPTEKRSTIDEYLLTTYQLHKQSTKNFFEL